MPSQGSPESRRYVIFVDKLMHELRFRAETSPADGLRCTGGCIWITNRGVAQFKQAPSATG
jgi:hypothetical protein